MSPLVSLVPPATPPNEAEAELFAATQLKAAGYDLTMRACRSPLLKKHWPSKAKTAKGAGFPDLLLHLDGMEKPVCVWENKPPTESATKALAEAQFYIEGLRKALPQEPGLPFIAAGYNGVELLIAVFTNEGTWVPLKSNGAELRDVFPCAEYVSVGVSAQGEFTAKNGAATAQDLRGLLPRLKTLYRNIPTLSSGRTPIDFTVALLTLKLVVEQKPDWGTWSEMPRFSPGSASVDHAIGERLEVYAKRILSDHELKRKYGDIFEFHEKSDTLEIAFSFREVMETIPKGRGNFLKLFELLDQLPPLSGADFDIFGEVYQAIGDEATKKKLGEFFTGRHIISGVLPVLFSRSGLDKGFSAIENLKIADPACGTGGFMTEILRLVRSLHSLAPETVKSFAAKAFYGYDIGHANASRARVNMYFAGDGFSKIEGGFDALSDHAKSQFPSGGFDIVATNPPYGTSSYGRLEEAFLLRVLQSLRAGTGWVLIVLPTGVLENPRSSRVRFALLNQAVITDVIALPKHAFAPYTLQRTAVVIAQRRKKPLVSADADWAALIAAAADEKIGMFVVDNDGYANSDKRYPTDKRDGNGEWLHNDLAPWFDGSGDRKPSKLYRALVAGVDPGPQVNEVGEPLEAKYGSFRVSELAHKERGIALLPDIPLRADLRSIKLKEWVSRVKAVQDYSMGKNIVLPHSFKEEVEFLLDHHIDVPKSSLQPAKTVKALCDSIQKGNQGLTEAAIYSSFDPKGLPVYGGGSGRPKFRAKKGLKRTTGELATVFKGPAAVVSMDGSSGSVQIVESGEFFCNHHAAVLTPKAGVDLWCFAQIAEPALRRLASNQGSSATLTKPALEGFTLRLPKGDAEAEIRDGRKLLMRLALLAGI
jgi:hypothetical protein